MSGEAKTPPAQNEIEVSIFGPGFGECILIHLGNGKWITIDSCINPINKEPAALSYFKEIGVDPSSAVIAIIATHWHSDHIRGLGELFRSCVNARFITSAALESEYFFELVDGSKGNLIHNCGFDEFRHIVDELERRKRVDKRKYLAPEFAVADKCIERNADYEIYTLSPSNAEMLSAIQSFKQLFPKHLEPKGHYLAFKDNNASVVLHVKAMGHTILLGGDLEEKKHVDYGWSAILSSKGKPTSKASVYKIPHHGSDTACHPAIWRTLLIDSPIAVLTPFVNGGVSLPGEKDIERLSGNTSELYATALPPQRIGSIKRNKTVERTIKETFKRLNKIFISRGHVRLRATKGSPWIVELFNDARKVA